MSQPETTMAAEVVSALDVAVQDARATYAAARPVSAAQAAAAAKVLPAGSTRSVLDFEPFPFRVAAASGARLHDVDGFTYVDLLGDYTAGLLGHDPPEVAAAVEETLARGWAVGAIGDGEHRLAELLCERFPSVDQIRFTNSGTEANLMAIQLARFVTGRRRVLVCQGGYHGGLLYFGSGGSALQMPFDFAMATYNDLASVAAHFADPDDLPACVLLEPMMGAGGVIRATEEFLTGVRRLCTEHGTRLIFDEVMTSRMSTGGAQLRLGVTPDLTTLGKYLGGGLTFGAFGGSADDMGAFDPARGGALTHGGTFNNNAFTMRAGAAAVEHVLTAEALDALFARGEALRARLVAVIGDRPLTVTGWGSMVGVHAMAPPVRRPEDLVAADPAVAELVFHGLLAEGFYMAKRGLIALSLALDDDDLDAFVTAFTRVIDDLTHRSLLPSEP
ncbi:MAG: aminotransferase class III-fold pyridoxal phosphate-dependent enzyme [Actinomycetota bacterium]